MKKGMHICGGGGISVADAKKLKTAIRKLVRAEIAFAEKGIHAHEDQLGIEARLQGARVGLDSRIGRLLKGEAL